MAGVAVQASPGLPLPSLMKAASPAVSGAVLVDINNLSIHGVDVSNGGAGREARGWGAYFMGTGTRWKNTQQTQMEASSGKRTKGRTENDNARPSLQAPLDFAKLDHHGPDGSSNNCLACTRPLPGELAEERHKLSGALAIPEERRVERGTDFGAKTESTSATRDRSLSDTGIILPSVRVHAMTNKETPHQQKPTLSTATTSTLLLSQHTSNHLHHHHHHHHPHHQRQHQYQHQHLHHKVARRHSDLEALDESEQATSPLAPSAAVWEGDRSLPYFEDLGFEEGGGEPKVKGNVNDPRPLSPSFRPTEHRMPAHLQLLVSNIKATKYLMARKLTFLGLIFLLSASVVFAIFHSFPPIDAGGGGTAAAAAAAMVTSGGGGGGGGGTELGRQVSTRLSFPRNLEELRALRDALDLYRQSYGGRVELGIGAVYLFLQTFMIPGSIFLNLLAGSLFGFYKALLFISVLSTVGSSLSYLLAHCILREILYQTFPERVDRLCRQVQQRRHNLVNYIMFMRITPIFPNWFTNMAAPCVGIPFSTFCVGTFVGLIPSHVVAVKAGGVLGKMHEIRELYDWQTIMVLVAMGGFALLPALMKRRKSDASRMRVIDLLKRIK